MLGKINSGLKPQLQLKAQNKYKKIDTENDPQ